MEEKEEEEAKTESKGWRMEVPVLEEKVLARRDRDRRFLNYSTLGQLLEKDYLLVRKIYCRPY